MEETVPLLAGPVLSEIETEVAYFQDFEGAVEDWSMKEGWRLRSADGNTVLKGSEHNWARLRGLAWDDYVFAARFMLLRGDMHVNFRQTDDASGLQRYFVGLATHTLSISKQRGGY